MHCRFCLFINPGDEERCQRCGKRLADDGTFDGIGLAGATALAPRRQHASMDISSEPGSSLRRPTRAAAATAGRQTALFGGELSSNIIPFESFQRPVLSQPAMTDVQAAVEPEPAA